MSVKLNPEPIRRIAIVTEVVQVTNQIGIIRYKSSDGTEGCSEVLAHWWGYNHFCYWPPAVGDVVEVFVQPVITFKQRKR